MQNTKYADSGKDAIRILVVEDDQNFREILSSHLRTISNDAKISSCASGSDALFLLHTRKYDLMIFDQNLEGSICGKRLWEICQKQFPSLPTILMSGIGIENFIKLFKSRSACPAFLPKPFRSHELREAVQNILTSKSQKMAA
ncbi:MAG: hypothetical protein A2Z20_06755 [Bdellovibrionales bacterium RBG_16_40_8]|nr:MAG: hypothetical protein A2Z20_06755 [Bdellovibrionales bacterium RBG_16_40_8]